MTHAAVRKLCGLDAIFFQQGMTESHLVGGPPGQIEHLVARPDETRRIPMTFQAPFHVERVFLPRERHLVHAPMTSGTADPFADMNAVIEENEIR